ncbi:MAG: S-adenosylmethionine decarboxylase [Candidatus Micrarchaeaceae archaeon]
MNGVEKMISGVDGFVGKHVLMDCQSSNIFKLCSIEYLYNFITSLTEKLGMTLVIPPVIVQFPFSGEADTLVKKLIDSGIKSSILDEFLFHLKKKQKQEAGISGIAIWAESHTSFHSWPDDMFFSLDIYSCKDFEPIIAMKYVYDYFNLTYFSYSIIDRYINSKHKICTGEVTDDFSSINYPCQSRTDTLYSNKQ